MAWPSTPVAVGDLVTAAQLNGLMVRLANTTLGSSAASIDFSSIPSIYAHLFFLIYLRGTDAGANVGGSVRFNGDTAGNYDAQYVNGHATTVSAAEVFAQGWAQMMSMPAAGAPANHFGAASLTVPHYAGTTLQKAAIAQWTEQTADSSNNLEVGKFGIAWRSTAAINRATFYPSAGSWAAGSRITLYGIPG